MSYLLIKVWSFECDHPGCQVMEDVPEPYLGDAEKALVAGSGWAKRKREHFCPAHRGAE